ncbi:septum formation initiator family protein [Georgenia sp. MJ206]|uniref:FtsB family cell division protein n=1 Tax=Georgenia wangjunii TaxID=3117730 RepID=UPI002F268968
MTSRRPPEPRRGAGAGRTPAAAPRRPAATPRRQPATPRRAAASRPTSARPSAARPGSRGSGRGTDRARGERTAALTESAAEHVPAPTITLRGLGLFLVLLIAFIVLAPTLRHAVEQQEELREVTAQVEAARARNAELEADLERWQDPIYVQAQARDRLGFIMPGETSYRVVDPETVVGEGAAGGDDGAAVVRQLEAPWYLSVWDSIQVAGETAPGEPAPGVSVPGATAPGQSEPGATPAEEGR